MSCSRLAKYNLSNLLETSLVLLLSTDPTVAWPHHTQRRSARLATRKGERRQCRHPLDGGQRAIGRRTAQSPLGRKSQNRHAIKDASGLSTTAWMPCRQLHPFPVGQVRRQRPARCFVPCFSGKLGFADQSARNTFDFAFTTSSCSFSARMRDILAIAAAWFTSLDSPSVAHGSEVNLTQAGSSKPRRSVAWNAAVYCSSHTWRSRVWSEAIVASKTHRASTQLTLDVLLEPIQLHITSLHRSGVDSAAPSMLQQCWAARVRLSRLEL